MHTSIPLLNHYTIYQSSYVPTDSHIHLSFHLSNFPSKSQCCHPFTCLSKDLSIHLAIRLTSYLFINLSIHLATYLSNTHFVYLYIYSSINVVDVSIHVSINTQVQSPNWVQYPQNTPFYGSLSWSVVSSIAWYDPICAIYPAVSYFFGQFHCSRRKTGYNVTDMSLHGCLG